MIVDIKLFDCFLLVAQSNSSQVSPSVFIRFKLNTVGINSEGFSGRTRQGKSFFLVILQFLILGNIENFKKICILYSIYKH